MRVLLSLFLILIIIGEGVAAVASSNSSIINSTQIQGYIQQIPAPSPNLFEEILNLIAQGYNFLIGLIQNILQNTLLKENPSLADTYANILGWLTILTAIYIILIVAEAFRKFIGYILIIGWIFILAIMVLAR
ncbi:MAG: hypothetical protein JHC28_06505 [Thermoprotei archaeon]|nr:hypothetical protein [Thermoprotei archaeon]